jgi:DNA repair protein SbcD/Mre11
VLTDALRPVDAMRALQSRFPHAVHMEWQRPDGNPELKYRDRVRGRSDLEIAEGFLTDVRSDATTGEVRLFEKALRSATAAESSTRAVDPADVTEVSA